MNDLASLFDRMNGQQSAMGNKQFTPNQSANIPGFMQYGSPAWQQRQNQRSNAYASTQSQFANQMGGKRPDDQLGTFNAQAGQMNQFKAPMNGYSSQYLGIYGRRPDDPQGAFIPQAGQMSRAMTPVTGYSSQYAGIPGWMQYGSQGWQQRQNQRNNAYANGLSLQDLFQHYGWQP